MASTSASARPALSRSALGVAREAYSLARAEMPRYSHRNSRHDFTQPQLFALLVLRQVFQTTYRDIVARTAEWPALRRTLRLKKVPHYSTLKYAEERLLKKGVSTASLPAVVAGRKRAA